MLKVNYKETLYFIAKCLTIFIEYKNRQTTYKQYVLKSILNELIISSLIKFK